MLTATEASHADGLLGRHVVELLAQRHVPFTIKKPFNSCLMAALKLGSLASPRVLGVHTEGTCGEVNEIKKILKMTEIKKMACQLCMVLCTWYCTCSSPRRTSHRGTGSSTFQPAHAHPRPRNLSRLGRACVRACMGGHVRVAARVAAHVRSSAGRRVRDVRTTCRRCRWRGRRA